MASLQSSFVYLSIAGDHTGKEVVRATMADDPDKLRQINQAIESAHDLWNAWAIANSGEVLSIEGDYLRIRVPTEKLRDVSDLRRRYSETLQAPVSVGFGTKLSEADQALKAAQKRGGDQILMFSPQIQELLEEKDELQKNQKLTFEEMKAHLAAKQARIKDLAQTTSGSAWKTPNGVIVVGLDPHNRDQWRATMVDDAGEPHGHNVAPSHEEALKFALGAGADIMQEPLKALKKGEEGDLLFSLKKEEPPLNSPAGGGGMTGPHQNAPAAPTAPTNEADEHSENEALRSAIMEGQGEGKLTGASPEGSSPDLHALLGEIATQQGQKDQSDQQAQQAQAQDAEGQDKMRQQVIQILKVFKDRSQELEGLQQQDPELYESMTGMLQIMTELAKDYFGQPQNEQDAQMVKSELAKALPRTPEENAANMQHEQVLQDMLSEKGQTFTGDQLPAKVAVNPRTQPRGIARREVKRPWSQSDHARIRAAETANADVDSTARFDSLASLPTAVNSQFQIPSFSFQPLGGTPPHAYRFSHYEIPLDYPHEIIHGAADRGRAFEYKLERGVPYIEVHGPRSGLIKLHPDRAERVYGGFPEDLQRHVFQHTQTLRDAMNPQSKTPMIGETGKVQHSLAQAPDATEMRAAMNRSPAFNKKLKKEDLMPGGKGDNKPDSAFDKEQLEAGAKLEAEEHGLDPARAREIAKDHLSENPNYYKRSMKKAWPRNEQENQANAASHAVLQDALEERGAKPIDHRTLPDTLENKIISMGRSPTNPKESRYRTEDEKDEADARRAAAIAYNRHIRNRDRDQLRNDPDIVAAAHAGPLGYTGALFPEEPASQEWPYSVIAPYGGGPRHVDGISPGGTGGDTKRQDDRADRDYWTAVDRLTGKETSGPVDQSDLRLRSPILKRSKPPLDKAALEAGKTGRHKVNYPVGTQIDGSPSGNHEAGEVKVQDPETGLTKWRSVRAGMVMAPDGTKTSSRNPGGSSGERQ